MKGLIEFMFESVPAKQVGALVKYLAGEISNLSEFNHSEVGELGVDNVLREEFWGEFTSSANSATCSLNIRALKIGTLYIPNVSLQIIHYNATTDIVILASSEDCKKGGASTSEGLYTWAKGVSAIFSVEKYSAGLEPASDEQTQLFSAKGIGPITEL